MKRGKGNEKNKGILGIFGRYGDGIQAGAVFGSCMLPAGRICAWHPIQPEENDDDCKQ